MANSENILVGDHVIWARQNQLIHGVVEYKTPKLIALAIPHQGEKMIRYANAKDLRRVSIPIPEKVVESPALEKSRSPRVFGSWRRRRRLLVR